MAWQIQLKNMEGAWLSFFSPLASKHPQKNGSFF